MQNTTHDIEVVLIRHAQSQWNKENRFTGWADPPLTSSGMAEARKAGEQLRIAGYRFDYAYSSKLQRARHTLCQSAFESSEYGDNEIRQTNRG